MKEPKKDISIALEAIILALLIHAAFLTVVYISDEGIFSSKKKGSSATEVNVEMIELTEELLALVPEPENELDQILDKYKNVTSKENEPLSDQIKSYSFNQSKVDDEVLQNLKKLESETFDQLENQRDKEKEGQLETNDPKDNTADPTPDKKPTKNNSNSYSKATSNYDFSRNHEYKKDPAYMCRLYGQIIVEISVDRDGVVTSAKAVSGDLEKDCLREQSERYASGWKFKASSDSPKTEKGTITFTFLPQD